MPLAKVVATDTTLSKANPNIFTGSGGVGVRLGVDESGTVSFSALNAQQSVQILRTISARINYGEASLPVNAVSVTSTVNCLATVGSCPAGGGALQPTNSVPPPSPTGPFTLNGVSASSVTAACDASTLKPGPAIFNYDSSITATLDYQISIADPFTSTLKAKASSGSESLSQIYGTIDNIQDFISLHRLAESFIKLALNGVSKEAQKAFVDDVTFSYLGELPKISGGSYQQTAKALTDLFLTAALEPENVGEAVVGLSGLLAAASSDILSMIARDPPDANYAVVDRSSPLDLADERFAKLRETPGLPLALNQANALLAAKAALQAGERYQALSTGEACSPRPRSSTFLKRLWRRSIYILQGLDSRPRQHWLTSNISPRCFPILA